MMLFDLLIDPTESFEEIGGRSSRAAFKFFLVIMVILSVATPIANYFGIESNDLSSAYLAQILAYRFSTAIMPLYGVHTYFIEGFLIIGLAIVYLLFLTGFVHAVFGLMGGKGLVSQAVIPVLSWRTQWLG